MRLFVNSVIHRGRTFRLAVGLCSLLMLVMLPAQRPHQFAVHYRTTQFRRTLEQNACVADTEAGTSDRVAHEASLPSILVRLPVYPVRTVRISRINQIVTLTPLPRLLLRLKLRSSSDSQDPLV